MNYLLFVDDADDAACFPAGQLLGMTCAGDGALILNFVNTLGPNASEDKRSIVTLTITADTEKAVMKAIAQAANAPINQGGVVTVCDDVASEFLTSDILSCAIDLDA